MKKIIFFFLLSVNLCFAQSIGLYQTGLAASSPTINVMAGNQITVNNTLENCVPNYDGSDCLLSYVDYELDFYLVQGTTEYHLGNELSLVAGVNCSASQPWASVADYVLNVPCYIPAGSYDLRVELNDFHTSYPPNL